MNVNGLRDIAVGLVAGFAFAVVVLDSDWKRQAKREGFFSLFKPRPVSALERQKALWYNVDYHKFLLSEDEQELVDALKLRLDYGLELHEQHEAKLRAMSDRIQERTSW
jgi:hypothetical protein